MANYFTFKTEFDARMIEVHEKLRLVSDLIKENCGDIPDSILIFDKQSYLNCLKLEHDKLEMLFRADESYWRK